jgi:hypothetical protein
VNGFDVITYLQSFSILNYWNCFFHDSLNYLNFRDLYYSFDYFLYNYRNFHYFLDNCLNGDNFFPDDLNLLRLLLNVVDYPLNFNYFFDFDYLLLHNNNFNNLRNLNVYVDNFLHDHGNLNDSFDNLLNGNDFFYNLSLNNWDLKRNIHCFLNLHNFLNLYNFFHFFCYWNNHWDLHSSLNYLFNYLFNLNNFRNRSKYF